MSNSGAQIYNNSFKFNHTCLRVKDPKVSVPFYQEKFGMKLLQKFDFKDLKFTLYMLAMDEPGLPFHGANWADREGCLELTHNWGTETDPNYQSNNGNKDPYRGFGHICFSVDNIAKSCDELEKLGVEFQKKITDGRQKDIAFALDPDGYWIEIIENGINKNEAKTEFVNNRFNHTMIRVKDPAISLDFYRNVLGMKLFSTRVHENAQFTLYFLGYDHDENFVEDSELKPQQAKRQSVLELTHNWGTESDTSFKGYHNGNDAPVGYGHIGISMNNALEFCQYIETKFPAVNWRLKFNQGKLKNIAFVTDPDGYSIEIIPNDMKTPC